MNDATINRLGSLSRKLRRIPGTVLLLEHLRKRFARAARVMRIDDFDGSLAIDLNLGEHMQSQIFWYGYYSRDIIMVMDKLLSPGMVMFDVGANIGEISLCAARRVGKAGKVYSFEPMPALYETLKRNLSRNGMMHVQPVCMGLSDKEGSVPIYRADTHFSDGTLHEGLGTLYPMNNRTSPAGEIKITTLDAFCEERRVDKLDCIKIDVEGAEFDVLKGGEKTLSKYKPHLIVELQEQTASASGRSPKDILEYLETLGYSFFSIGRKARLHSLHLQNIKSFQNVLCVPK